MPGANEVAVTASDLQSLNPGEQVCDSVIDVFAAILTRENKKLFALTTYEMMQMAADNQKYVAKMVGTRKNIFNRDHCSAVMFPVHVGSGNGSGHWCLAVFTPKNDSLLVYNSLVTYREAETNQTIDLISTTLVALHAALYEPRSEDWYRALVIQVKHVTCPQQIDGSSCGIYTIVFMLNIAKGKEDEPKFNDSTMNLMTIRNDILQIVHRGYIEK